MVHASQSRPASPIRWALRFLGFSAALMGATGIFLHLFEDDPASLILMKLAAIPLLLLAGETINERMPLPEGRSFGWEIVAHQSLFGLVNAAWLLILMWQPDQQPARMILSFLLTWGMWPLLMGVIRILPNPAGRKDAESRQDRSEPTRHP
ncbi:hypothetical protein GCM10011390_29710 [Aureimonas endophytica]|uniref:Uncharacterized protein n=1 Tax=Aureimonas endophytica TaxID=2027858 RepID=A0A917E668_9HYPH|nr:hypothetical protein [Aureimonas endophytica]GGE08671.1 hypothetical protein GCM10011390_29710 [Aureimonas endophytica]